MIQVRKAVCVVLQLKLHQSVRFTLQFYSLNKNYNFLFLYGRIKLYCLQKNIFINSTVGGNLVFFYVQKIMNRVIKNMDKSIPTQLEFFGQDVQKQYSWNIWQFLAFWGNLHTVSHSGCISCHSHRHYVTDPLFPKKLNKIFCLLFS